MTGSVNSDNAPRFGRRRQGRRRGGGRSYQPMSQINVTPMVDVMLVLLVVFMITAPLLTVGVPVNLPKTEAGAINDKIEPLTVTIMANGQLFLEDTLLAAPMLLTRLKAIRLAKPETVIFVRADQGLSYGRVMEVMGLVAKSGFRKVSLITENPTASSLPADGSGAVEGGDGESGATGASGASGTNGDSNTNGGSGASGGTGGTFESSVSSSSNGFGRAGGAGATGVNSSASSESGAAGSASRNNTQSAGKTKSSNNGKTGQANDTKKSN